MSNSADQFLTMLKQTNGRDCIMCAAEFSPVAAPLLSQEGGKSINEFADMAGRYRAITRMEGLFKTILKKTNPPAPPKSAAIRAFNAKPHVAVVKQINYLFDLGFFGIEGIKVLTLNNVVNRAMPVARKNQIGPLQDWLWFWQLIFLMVEDALTYLELKGHSGTEEGNACKAAARDFMEHFLWFLFAWTCQPKDGSKAQLLASPASSALRPLHTIIEASTIPAFTADVWTAKFLGMVATVIPLAKAWGDAK